MVVVSTRSLLKSPTIRGIFHFWSFPCYCAIEVPNGHLQVVLDRDGLTAANPRTYPMKLETVSKIRFPSCPQVSRVVPLPPVGPEHHNSQKPPCFAMCRGFDLVETAALITPPPSYCQLVVLGRTSVSTAVRSFSCS